MSLFSQSKPSDSLPEVLIRFGEGGGITGAFKEYCLLKTGQILLNTKYIEDFEDFKKIKKRKAKRCFKTYNKKNIEKVKLNKPGDKYYFIIYQTEEGEHKITWGTNKDLVPKDVIDWYEQLKSLVVEKEK